MLEVDSLSAAYGPVRALDGVSLRVEAGEAVALLGANGAGKSTLLKCLSGLMQPAGGTIRYRGREVTGGDPVKLVADGLIHVPERRRIFGNLTVEENLTVATAGWRKSGGYGDLLDRVYGLFPRLAERRKQGAWSLSGGEQQMLAVGRAIMAKPKLLLLDEPSLGLAPLVAEDIYRHIAEIAAAGVAVLVVEQNTALALSVARRGYVLETGRIVLQGGRDSLLNDPSVRDAYLGR